MTPVVLSPRVSWAIGLPMPSLAICLFALRQKGKVERAAMAIGRAYRDTGPVAVRPGPVRVYAAGSV